MLGRRRYTRIVRSLNTAGGHRRVIMGLEQEAQTSLHNRSCEEPQDAPCRTKDAAVGLGN